MAFIVPLKHLHLWAAGALAIVFGWFLAYGLGTVLLVPLIVAIRRCFGRPYRGASPVPYVAEASAWSELTVVVLIVVLLVALGVASLEYGPLLALWTEPPGPVAVTVFVVTAIGVVVSYWLQSVGERNLFCATRSEIPRNCQTELLASLFLSKMAQTMSE